MSKIDPRQNEAMDKDQVILVSAEDEYRGKCSKREAHLWKNVEKGGEHLLFFLLT